MYTRFRQLILLLLTLLTLNSCGSQTLAFKSLYQETMLRKFAFQTRQPSLVVFTNAQEIDHFLTQFASPIPGFPLVDELHHLDYDHFFAVLVLQGQSGGDSSVTVQQITRQDDRVIVSATFITPRSGEGQGGNITDAYHLVAIPKDSLRGQQIQLELVDNSIVGGGVVARTTQFVP